MKCISLVIPTYNEEENIPYLIRRIDETLQQHHIQYEIIFVDDHSLDLTQKFIHDMGQLYPVKLFLKIGEKGKAQSLLEGFDYAQYDTIAMIDADLQYPPEMIPKMIDVLQNGFDIVVADRKEKHTSIIRTIGSTICMSVFGKWLHQLDIDIQSGLKVFRKEITTRLNLHPSPWTFDLEFLVKARSAGYKATSIPMIFEKRFAGKSKVHIIQTAWQIGINALRLKFFEKEIIPFKQNDIKKKGKGFHYAGREFIHFSDLQIAESAFFQINTNQTIALLCLLVLFFFGLFLNWHFTLTAIISALTVIYFSDLLFNLFLIIRSFLHPSEIFITDEEMQKERNWPMYTIFCPLYKEHGVIPQFIEAIEKIDYPKDQLQVMLLLEEDDTETIAKAATLSLPSYVEIYIPPHSFPKTKPKALNFGLQYAKGAYAVVYDAEDIPDPKQLKKVILAFEKSQPQIKCIQAKLNFYNPFQNILTRVFTAEYSLWFDLVLTGLQSIHSVIPLGGTSNHFRLNDLKQMQGWDSFNVTEDCDLGLRLAKNGYQTAIVNSTTFEEANSNIFNWFNQRGRWIKGYMQTYLVHARNPKYFLAKAKLKKFMTFQLVIGGKVMSLFINPLMWCITLSYFAFRPFVGHFIESFFPTPIFYMGVLSLVFGNFLYIYYYMIGCAKREYFSLIKYAFLVPIYWLGMSLSGWNALYKIISQPHYWSKTHHGLHLKGEQKEKRKLTLPIYQPQISL